MRLSVYLAMWLYTPICTHQNWWLGFSQCYLVCVWMHLGVSSYACVCVCVCEHAKVCFCSSVFAQYPSAAKLSINLSTPQPTESPFLFPCIPILPFYLTPHSLCRQAPPYPTLSLSPTQSAILGIIVTCFICYTKTMHVHCACFSGMSGNFLLCLSLYFNFFLFLML